MKTILLALASAVALCAQNTTPIPPNLEGAFTGQLRRLLNQNFDLLDTKAAGGGLPAGSVVAGTALTLPGTLSVANAVVGSNIKMDAPGTHTFVGIQAGNSSSTGTGNTAVGYQAGLALTVPGAGVTNQANTLLGYQAGKSITTARESTFVGYFAGSSYVGSGAGTEDGLNTFVGALSGASMTTGHDNVCVGQKACTSTVSGSQNVYLGAHSANSLSGSQNVGIGAGVGDAGSPEVIVGDGNVMLGYQVATAAGTMNNNVLIGNSAGQVNVSDQNTFVGQGAGSHNTSGSKGVFIGSGAGAFNTATSGNVVVGYNALASGNVPNTVAIGHQTGRLLTSGSNNVLIGYDTGSNALTATSGTNIIGSGAAFRLTTGTNDNLYGVSAAQFATTGSYTLCIGDNVCQTWITGQQNTVVGGFGANVSTSAANYRAVFGSGAIGTFDHSVTLGTAAEVVIIPPTTVAGLPACSATTRGSMQSVTDSLAPAMGVTVASGGSAAAKVWCNGANWTVTGI
jgi:hypothetical protein